MRKFRRTERSPQTTRTHTSLILAAGRGHDLLPHLSCDEGEGLLCGCAVRRATAVRGSTDKRRDMQDLPGARTCRTGSASLVNAGFGRGGHGPRVVAALWVIRSATTAKRRGRGGGRAGCRSVTHGEWHMGMMAKCSSAAHVWNRQWHMEMALIATVTVAKTPTVAMCAA